MKYGYREKVGKSLLHKYTHNLNDTNERRNASSNWTLIPKCFTHMIFTSKVFIRICSGTDG